MKLLIISLILSSIQGMVQFKNYREIFIFPNGDQRELKKQMEVFAKDSLGISERDLKITVCETDTCKARFKAGVAYHQFMVILIGKDGGIKKTWNRLVATKELYELIDAMPMRRSEMGNKK